MPWVNHYVILGLQKIFGFVGKYIIKWPVLSICISIAISLGASLGGMYALFFVNPPMDLEALGASSGPGAAAAKIKNTYFPSQTLVSLVTVTLREPGNVFEHLPALCEMQRSLEDNELYATACSKDHTGKCTQNVYDLLLEAFSAERTDNAAQDCKLLHGTFLPSAVAGLGDKVEDLVGFARKGTFAKIGTGQEKSIDSARQMLLAFPMDSFHENTAIWENEIFIPTIKRLREKVGSSGFLGRVDSIEYLAGNSMESESQREIMADMPLVAGSFILMFIYCITMLVRKWKCPFFTQTRFGLAFMMMLTATLALGCAYGFQGFTGESFSALSLATAFIIYGVGIDDTFVIVDAYARINRDRPKRKEQTTNEYIEHNILEAYVETSDAIVLTTLTDCVAFFTGATLDVIAMRGFCITAGVAVLCVFILQSTFFLPCLVLDERRRLGKRYDVFCCIRADRRNRKKIAAPDPATESTQTGQTPLEQVRAMFTAKDRFNFMRFLFNVPTAIFVVLLFVVAGSFNGIWAWNNLNKNLDPTDFLPKDSYVLPFLDTWLAGKEDNYPMYVDYIFTDVDFGKQKHRSEIIKVYRDQTNSANWELEDPEMRKFTVNDSILGPGAIAYLMSEYPAELPHRNEEPGPAKANPQSVELWLEENPMHLSSFNVTDSTVVTRFQLKVNTVSPFETRAVHRTKIQETADKSLPSEASEIKVYVYEMLFSQIDRFIGIDGYFFGTVVSSIIGVFVVNCFFTLPLYALVSTICVAFVIGHILIIFPLAGIDYNTMLVINLVLAIGFAVDYCAHIGQHFANNPQKSPKVRALGAINTMAGSVLKAGFSTILAVSCLVFSNGLVTGTLLKCFIVMVIAGLAHALVFMPCTLFLLATAYESIFPKPKKSDPEIPLVDDAAEMILA